MYMQESPLYTCTLTPHPIPSTPPHTACSRKSSYPRNNNIPAIYTVHVLFTSPPHPSWSWLQLLKGEGCHVYNAI